MRGVCGHTFLQQTLLTNSARSGCCESAAPPLLPGSGCMHALNIMVVKSLHITLKHSSILKLSML